MNTNTKNMVFDNVTDISLDDYIRDSNILNSTMSKSRNKVYDNNLNKHLTETFEWKETEQEDILVIKNELSISDDNFDARDILNDISLRKEKDNSTSNSSTNYFKTPNNRAQNSSIEIPPLAPTSTLQQVTFERNNSNNLRYQLNARRNRNSYYKNQYHNKPYYRYNSNKNYNNQTSRNYNNNFSSNLSKIMNDKYPVSEINTNDRNHRKIPSLLEISCNVYDSVPAEMLFGTTLNNISYKTEEHNKKVMPIVASKLLEALGVSAESPPKYNMKIQKEIHAIQNKPMIYRCNKAVEIISSDGPGINTVIPIKPNSTGITLNQRFS